MQFKITMKYHHIIKKSKGKELFFYLTPSANEQAQQLELLSIAKGESKMVIGLEEFVSFL